MKEKLKYLFTILATVIVTLAAVFLFATVYLAKYDVPFEKLFKVVSIIKSSYVGEFDIEKSEESAINAVLESIEDKYAVYYDEKNAEEMMQMIDGHYIGIGIEIFANTEKGRIEVISAYEDSPADKAGVKSGDLIKAIDGKEYSASEMADAVSYMKGVNVENPLEVEFTITLIRGEEEIETRMKREVITLYKVYSEMVDNICYIRYSGYTEESVKELGKIVEGFDENVHGVVVDVRNNPGGEFGSAIKMCDMFLDEGTIMYTLDKKGKKTSYNARKGGCSLPLAVLVDGATASAAEIFAGAVQALDRGIIIGEKTYGKGETQTVRYLNHNDTSEGALKLTTGRNYTSDGRWINESIIPDKEIKSERAENIAEDAAFKAAAEYIKEEIK